MSADKGDAGLLHALVLDGKGGARVLGQDALDALILEEGESLWLHWDRGQPQAQTWLRKDSGLDAFVCDVLLEDEPRPRLLPLQDDGLLLFLRGVNLSPDADPEDMVSLRVFAEPHRVISLRLRPLHASEAVLRQLKAGIGPKTVSELLVCLAETLTEHAEEVISRLDDALDEEEEHLESDHRYTPPQNKLLTLRRRAASLRRFLLPQSEIYGQLSRKRFQWFATDDSSYWNELNNRLLRYLEELELARERANLVLEAEERRMRERMNRTMYLLGIITGFFLPMSFLTGLLGMNVGGIPAAENPWGFALTCGLIAGVAAFQWWLFRRLKWV